MPVRGRECVNCDNTGLEALNQWAKSHQSSSLLLTAPARVPRRILPKT